MRALASAATGAGRRGGGRTHTHTHTHTGTYTPTGLSCVYRMRLPNLEGIDNYKVERTH